MNTEQRIGLLVAARMLDKNISANELAERLDAMSREESYRLADIENIILGKFDLDLRTTAKLDTLLGKIIEQIFDRKIIAKLSSITSPKYIMMFPIDKNTEFLEFRLQNQPA